MRTFDNLFDLLKKIINFEVLQLSLLMSKDHMTLILHIKDTEVTYE